METSPRYLRFRMKVTEAMTDSSSGCISGTRHLVLAGVILSACITHYELPAMHRADATPMIETPAFVVAPPRGNWIEGRMTAGSGEFAWVSCVTVTQSSEGVSELLYAIRLSGPTVSNLDFCKVSSLGLDVAGEGASHLSWGLSIVAFQLADDTLALDDSVRAATLANSLRASELSREVWKGIGIEVLRVGDVPVQLMQFTPIGAESPYWMSLRVHGGIACALISRQRPSPSTEEYHVLESLRPRSQR